jgi:hypothetical protein
VLCGQLKAYDNLIVLAVDAMKCVHAGHGPHGAVVLSLASHPRWPVRFLLTMWCVSCVLQVHDDAVL